VTIACRDYWVKIVDFLQQNWALIDDVAAGVVVWFVDDEGGVFDAMPFDTRDRVELGLRRNGFRRFAEDAELRSFVTEPQLPFRSRPHPNGKIYSSGRFWK
jgi:hypothetical protein